MEHGIEHRLAKVKHPWSNGQGLPRRRPGSDSGGNLCLRRGDAPGIIFLSIQKPSLPWHGICRYRADCSDLGAALGLTRPIASRFFTATAFGMVKGRAAEGSIDHPGPCHGRAPTLAPSVP
jgi:hypothetical protein